MIVVSIVITTKNEENNIEKCLLSVASQTSPSDSLEVIVVDNDSSDKTVEIARKYSTKVFNHGPERSAQRNFGVGQAEGKYILYLDADMALSENVVRVCTEKLEGNDGVVALYVAEKIRGRGFWGKVRAFERGFYDATVIDAVRFVRKDIFQKVGGFDENLTGPEDWDFDKKIRGAGKVELIKAPLYHHEEDFDIKKYLARKKYYARDFEKYAAKWGKNDPDIRKQFGFGYRYFGVFMEKGKWRKLIKHPILSIGMYYLRFLIGLKYMFS